MATINGALPVEWYGFCEVRSIGFSPAASIYSAFLSFTFAISRTKDDELLKTKKKNGMH